MSKVAVRKIEDRKAFVTKNLAFEVSGDLLDYKIIPELKQLCKILDDIYNKSNSTLITDLLEDIRHSIQIELGTTPRKTVMRKDLEDYGML